MREEIVNWWKSLESIERVEFKNKHFPKKPYHKLTSEDIVAIFHIEVEDYSFQYECDDE